MSAFYKTYIVLQKTEILNLIHAASYQVHKDFDEGHWHSELGRQDGQDASSERSHAAEEVLQPSVPVWRGWARPPVHDWPPPGGEQWQDGSAGQAAAQDEGAGYVGRP